MAREAWRKTLNFQVYGLNFGHEEKMQIIRTRLGHRIKKALKLGPRASLRIVENKLKAKIFRAYWRNKAIKRSASHSWSQIANKYRLRSSCAEFLTKLHSRHSTFTNNLALDLPLEHLCALADQYAQKKFDILGSGLQQFEAIPWHEDFRLKAQNPSADYRFPANQFYQDITIHAGETENLVKDIKIPWELSRFQHLLILGQAYQQTGNNSYAQAFQEQIQDWLQHNPFMLGNNWVCPMDVGLRAINWIVAFEYFKNAQLPESFWSQFVCSLYDHLFYLENNWEVYDGVTSNHYLSDLIGYFYLCYFFENFAGMHAKRDWCFAQILSECDKQIFAQGASYEGSTAYHRLVTELFVHAWLLARQQSLAIPETFHQKLGRMLAFIDWCTPQGGMLITIGDNDSGCVTTAGITKKARELFSIPAAKGQTEFLEFGLSVIKTDTWHITLRQHAYQAQQPSGHFHNDVGSITLAINGIPLFVDPGSYLYTPSRTWRNKFRSVMVHNTVFVQGYEPVPLDERLFIMAMPEKSYVPMQQSDHQLIAHNELYSKSGISLNREVNLSEDAVLKIRDDVRCDKNLDSSDKKMIWNFTLSPEIQVKEKDQKFQFLHEEQLLATMHSPSLDFKILPTWVSLEYGKKVESFCLQAHAELHQIKELIQEIFVELPH